jgi:hypothetical protein
MPRPIWNAAIVIVPLLTIAVVTPWGASSLAEFSPGVIKALLAGALVLALLLYGWPLFSQKVMKRDVPADTAREVRLKLRLIAFLGLVASTGVLELMRTFGGRLGIRSDVLITMAVAGQQVIFALTAFLVGRLATVLPRGLWCHVLLIFISVVAAQFALNMPALLHALSSVGQPAPLEYRNLAWCIPTLLVSIFMIVRIHRVRSRLAE